MPNFFRSKKEKSKIFLLKMNEPIKEITLERARELIGNKDISEEQLKKILDKLKVFCNVAYQLYQKKDSLPNEEHGNINL